MNPTKTSPATNTIPTDLACKEAALRISGVAHPARLGILILLEGGPMHVGAIVEALADAGQAAVSHHLNNLKLARVVEATRDKQRVFYNLTATGHALARSLRPLLEVEEGGGE